MYKISFTFDIFVMSERMFSRFSECREDVKEIEVEDSTKEKSFGVQELGDLTNSCLSCIRKLS